MKLLVQFSGELGLGRPAASAKLPVSQGSEKRRLALRPKIGQERRTDPAVAYPSASRMAICGRWLYGRMHA